MTAPRNNPYLQPLQYAVAGATSIPCTKWARRVVIWEDGSVAGGLKVTFPNGTVANYAPEQQPIILADLTAEGGGAGRYVGRPAQTDGKPLYTGDIYCVVQQLTGTSTLVNVAEYD